MAEITFEKLIDRVECDGHDTDCIERFQFTCAVKNLSKITMKGYAERIDYLHRYGINIERELTELTTRDIQQYILSILNKVSPETVNGRIRVYKVFYKLLTIENLIKSDPMQSVSLVRSEKKVKPVLSPEQIGLILKQFDRRTFHGERDYCMILLTFDAMLRVSELLSIKLEDLDLKSRLVKVYGKGRKERHSPFSELTARRIRTYLAQHRSKLSGDLLFSTENGKQITIRRAHSIFKKPAMKVGIHFHPHLARHSGASQFIRSGGSPSILQKILGHSSLMVTQKYIHLNNDDMISSFDYFSPGKAIV